MCSMHADVRFHWNRSDCWKTPLFKLHLLEWEYCSGHCFSYLLIPDLQVSSKLYSFAFMALNMMSILTVSIGRRIPKPSLGWTSTYWKWKQVIIHHYTISMCVGVKMEKQCDLLRFNFILVNTPFLFWFINNSKHLSRMEVNSLKINLWCCSANTISLDGALII